MDGSGQTARVRELREAGLAPKKIARALGLRGAEVLAVLNDATGTAAWADGQAQVRCWISGGWASEVRVTGEQQWPGLDADVESPGGLVCVLVARRHRHDKVTVCGYLVDVHCLGVKNATGPEVMDEPELLRFRRQFFGAYLDHQPAPFELARQLVLGAVDYAHALGFQPHPDFSGTAAQLEGPLVRCDIEFGLDGKPFYMEGPYDDSRTIIRTLDATVGPGSYHYYHSQVLSR